MSNMRKLDKRTILIVDDDPGDVRLLENILESDYFVIKAYNAWKALAIINEKHPDIVIMDIMMPKKSGYTLCVLVKNNPDTKDIPVIMVTGLDSDLNKEIGENMGADGYLVKPIQPRKLLAIISRLLMSEYQVAKC